MRSRGGDPSVTGASLEHAFYSTFVGDEDIIIVVARDPIKDMTVMKRVAVVIKVGVRYE